MYGSSRARRNPCYAGRWRRQGGDLGSASVGELEREADETLRDFEAVDGGGLPDVWLWGGRLGRTS